MTAAQPCPVGNLAFVTGTAVGAGYAICEMCLRRAAHPAHEH